MSCPCLSRLAARRIRFNAHCTSARPCVRNVFCRRRFPLARSLFSISSAATEVALFGDFLDTMDLSASNALRLRLPVSVHLRVTPSGFSSRLAAPTAASRHGTSRFSCEKVLYMLRAFASPWALRSPRGVRPTLAITLWSMLSSAGVQHVDTPIQPHFAATLPAHTPTNASGLPLRTALKPFQAPAAAA